MADGGRGVTRGVDMDDGTISVAGGSGPGTRVAAPWQQVPPAEGAGTATAPGDRWFCGPAADRRAYAVDDIAGIQGGEGRVVRAERRSRAGDPVGFTGPVSLKLTTDHRPERVALLQERWARLATIEHPGLARAVEVFEGPGLFRTTCPPLTDDVLYVAAAWVEGRPLRSVGTVDPPTAAGLARDLAAALAALHEHGMVHRDVHPGNVVVGDEGRAVLIDFGCCRSDDAAATGTVTGTLGFIPPEELHGTGGPAADRWGLGMVTIFALLGHPQGPAGRSDLVRDLEAALAGAGSGDPRRAARLLAEMVEPDPDRRPTDPVSWAHDLTDAVAGTPRTHRRRLLTAAVAVLVAGAAAALAGAATQDPPTPHTGVGADAGAAGCEPAGQGGTPTLADAAERLAPDACAGGEPQMFVEAEFQAIADHQGRDEGVILVAPSGDAVRLNAAMWTSYREIAGKVSPENAVLYGGYPVRVERTDDPAAVLVRLDRGGYLVGHRDDTQLFWLPTPVLDLYEAHGGLDGDLGFPTTNPYPVGEDLHLDFEHGYMAAPLDQLMALLQGEPVETAVVLPDPAGSPDTAPVRERIVRQASGTGWWIDADGVRHWIPDGTTWECLGDDAVVAESHARGWSVAAYPLAEPAVCP